MSFLAISGRSLLRAATTAIVKDMGVISATCSSRCSNLLHLQQQTSSSSTTTTSSSEQPTLDPFTRSLQQKTEEQLLSLLEQARQSKLQGAAPGAGEDDEQDEEQDEDDEVDLLNPETGEVAGPRGKEPTRYGDWEVKGRATDFA